MTYESTQTNLFKDWLKTNLTEEDLTEIAENGLDNSGYPGITYYSDRVKLYQQFESDIWEIIFNAAESQGENNHFACLAQCSALDNMRDLKSLKSALVAYAAESICYAMANEV